MACPTGGPDGDDAATRLEVALVLQRFAFWNTHLAQSYRQTSIGRVDRGERVLLDDEVVRAHGQSNLVAAEALAPKCSQGALGLLVDLEHADHKVREGANGCRCRGARGTGVSVHRGPPWRSGLPRLPSRVQPPV